MAVSAKVLQQQVDELHHCCPALLPGINPHGLDIEALMLGLQGSNSAIDQFLANSSRQVSSCFICGAAGPAGGVTKSQEGGCALRLMASCQVDFVSRSMICRSAGFACGSCRALRDPCRLMQFAGLRLGPEETDREQLLQELCMHFASINHAPEAIQSNPDALVIWVQEVFSRAYALKVLASNLKGWKTVDCDGQPVDLSSTPSRVKLLKQLVSMSVARQEGKKADKKRKERAMAQPHAAESIPLGKRQKGSKVANNGAGEHAEQQQETLAPARQGQTPKQPDAGRAARGSAKDDAPAAAGSQHHHRKTPNSHSREATKGGHQKAPDIIQQPVKPPRLSHVEGHTLPAKSPGRVELMVKEKIKSGQAPTHAPPDSVPMAAKTPSVKKNKALDIARFKNPLTNAHDAKMKKKKMKAMMSV